MQWGYLYAGATHAAVVADLRRQLHRDRLPIAWVALDGGEPVGTVCLRAHDVGRKDLSPWLSGLYVVESHRNAGLGRRLVETALAGARTLGAHNVYAATLDRQRYFLRLGWHEIQWSGYQGYPMAILQRELRSYAQDCHPPS